VETNTQPIDDADRRPNLGCGFVAGALAGATCLFTVTDWSVMVIAGLVAGILGARFGERLWRSLARWIQPARLAKLSAVLGLGLAVPYGGFLARLLYRLYGPAHEHCGTPEVLALTAGAVVVAPLAVLLVVAMARYRAGIAAHRAWQAVSCLAVVALLLAVGANWLVFLRLIAP
jgi:hypothetical protein